MQTFLEIMLTSIALLIFVITTIYASRRVEKRIMEKRARRMRNTSLNERKLK